MRGAVVFIIQPTSDAVPELSVVALSAEEGLGEEVGLSLQASGDPLELSPCIGERERLAPASGDSGRLAASSTACRISRE